MVILKKIRAATLLEVLTASVLIVIVFMIASLSFNTVFTNQVKNDRTAIESRIKELEYLLIHQKIKLPYAEDFDGWEIMISPAGHYVLLSYEKGEVELEKRWIAND